MLLLASLDDAYSRPTRHTRERAQHAIAHATFEACLATDCDPDVIPDHHVEDNPDHADGHNH